MLLIRLKVFLTNLLNIVECLLLMGDKKRTFTPLIGLKLLLLTIDNCLFFKWEIRKKYIFFQLD